LHVHYREVYTMRTTTTISLRRWLGLLATVLTVGCSTALPAAQSGETAAYGDDSPPLIAGRVAAVDGDVRIWRTEEDGDGAWDRAQLNDVVTVGTGLAADDGRTEVRIGPHAFRLGAGSVGGFSQLDFGAKTFNLERGVINIRLAAAQQGEAVAVEVGGVRIDLAAPGSYRVDAVDNAPLRVTVFQGQGVVRHGTNNVPVGNSQALVMTQSSMNFAAAVATPLDEWAFARDARFQQVQAARYVSPYMTGFEELDAHGDWVPDASFGTVWMPRAVPVGWAPYRDGRWRWVQPWGWTWVDAAPWGYAPFHYGRWVVIGNRWGWWPGNFVARPVWAPALVGFVGGGTSVSIRFGGPVVGWYPLAPWHPYRPHFRSSPTYVTVINQTIIQRPPRGTPPDVNQRPGSTWVPQPRFREPIVKVRIPAQTEKVADLRPMAPPPRPKRTAPVSDDARSTPPAGRVAPPHVRSGQSVAQTAPKYNVAPPQPLPGADTTLSQPAPIRRVEPRPLPPAPRQLPEREAPRPKPNLPQEIVPPYQQLQKPFPAEPARTPPAAPPTVRQPGQSQPGNSGNRSQQGSPGNAPRGVSAAPPTVRTAAPPVNQRAPAAAPSQRTAPVTAPVPNTAPAATAPQPVSMSKQQAMQGSPASSRGSKSTDSSRSKTMER
jgi:hypothetical protein